MKLIRALFRGKVGIIAVFIYMMSVAIAPINADFVMDFNLYSEGTPVSSFNYPGVTFSGPFVIRESGHFSTPALVYAGPSASGPNTIPLVVNFDEPQIGFSFVAYGIYPC